MSIAEDCEPTGEELLVGHDVGCPVERVAAVVDGAAALGLLMDRAKKLPLGSSHLGTRLRTARRGVEEEPYDELVAFGDEESTKLVEPDGAIDARRRLGELVSCLARYRLSARGCAVVMEGSKMLLQLKG